LVVFVFFFVVVLVPAFAIVFFFRPTLFLPFTCFFFLFCLRFLPFSTSCLIFLAGPLYLLPPPKTAPLCFADVSVFFWFFPAPAFMFICFRYLHVRSPVPASGHFLSDSALPLSHPLCCSFFCPVCPRVPLIFLSPLLALLPLTFSPRCPVLIPGLCALPLFFGPFPPTHPCVIFLSLAFSLFFPFFFSP